MSTNRYRVTLESGRVFFVYGRTEVEACRRLDPSLPIPSARVELAGHVSDDGRLVLPQDEVRVVMMSTCDDRVAPMK